MELLATLTEAEQMTIFQLLPLIRNMEIPFLAHFFGEGTSGDTFAHWVVTSGTGAGPTQDGRMTYEAMKAMGAEEIIKLLRMYNPIWSKIGGLTAKTAEFITNFLAYDELQKADEDEDEAGEEATA
jgi:hypothetical protein